MEISYIFGKLIQFIQIPQIHNSTIDKSSRVRYKCLIVNSSIGRNSYVSENSVVLYSNIGNFTSIASNCSIGGASHPIGWLSTSPVFQKCKSDLKQKINAYDYNPYKETKIGSDVWIGTNVLVKAGVTIGDGAVIGMGSVVTKDVGPFEVWAGNPARKIKKRFSEEIIKSLLEIKWWNLSDLELLEKDLNVTDVESVIKELSK